MAKTKLTISHPHTGIKHNTSSARTPEHSSRGFDWFWLLLALISILAIAIAAH